MNFEEFVKYRKNFIHGNLTNLIQRTGRRGTYNAASPILISEFTKHCFIPFNVNKRFTDIVDAELALVYNGTTCQLTDELYENDDNLYAAYRRLQLHRLAGNATSRNNVITEPECCLCYWQLYDKVLSVVSRSMDVQHAGLTDCCVVDGVAQLIDADAWVINCIIPHIYLNKDSIARRPT